MLTHNVCPTPPPPEQVNVSVEVVSVAVPDKTSIFPKTTFVVLTVHVWADALV